MNQKIKNRISEIVEELSVIRDEEDDKLSNMEERFGETERFQLMSEQKDRLDESLTYLEEIIEN